MELFKSLRHLMLWNSEETRLCYFKYLGSEISVDPKFAKITLVHKYLQIF